MASTLYSPRVVNNADAPEHSSIWLHSLLHVQPDGGRRLGAIRIAYLVQEFHALKTSFVGDLHVRLARSKGFLDVVGASTAENNNVQKRVRAKTVGTVHGHRCSLAGSIQTRNDLVFAILYYNKETQLSKKVLGRTWSTVSTSPVYFVGIPPTIVE